MNEQKIAPVLSDDEIAEIVRKWHESIGSMNALLRATEQAVLARVGAVREQAMTLGEYETEQLALHCDANVSYVPTYGKRLSFAPDQLIHFARCVIDNHGLSRDQTLEEAAAICDSQATRRWRDQGKFVPSLSDAADAIRALKGTPAAAVADALPLSSPLRQHVEWIHSVMRETGHCIDGGVCHHKCTPKPEASCFRRDFCYPLAGSRLNDDWTLPSPQSSGNPGPLAAVERMAVILKALQSAQNNLASHRPNGSSDPESDDYDHDAFMWDYYQRAIDAAIAASKEGASHGQ